MTYYGLLVNGLGIYESNSASSHRNTWHMKSELRMFAVLSSGVSPKITCLVAQQNMLRPSN